MRTIKKTIKNLLNRGKEVVMEGVEAARQSVSEVQEMSEKAAKRLELRIKLKEEHKKQQEKRVEKVNLLFEKNDIVASYTTRSGYQPYVKTTIEEYDPSGNIESKTIYRDWVLPKITVVGLVRRTGLKEYSLIVNYSEYNPTDKNYSAQIGYQEAVYNALERKTGRNIEIEHLPTEFNKELFFAVADSILKKERNYVEAPKKK